MISEVRPKYPLTVFYDGSCPICSREMSGYRHQLCDKRFYFVDISRPGFDPSVYGRSRKEFMAMLHVMDASERFYVGVEAFRALWQALPGRFYPFLASFAGVPGVHALARIGYYLFARLRRHIPRFKS